MILDFSNCGNIQLFEMLKYSQHFKNDKSLNPSCIQTKFNSVAHIIKSTNNIGRSIFG